MLFMRLPHLPGDILLLVHGGRDLTGRLKHVGGGV